MVGVTSVAMISGKDEMPVAYVVLDQGTLVLELWVGAISHDEVLAHERRHLSDSSVIPGASVLVDAISASFETMPEMVQEVTDLYRRPVETLKVGKVALLVSASAYDHVQLYEKQASESGVRVIMFNSLDVACTWLGIDGTRARQEFEKLRANLALV